MKFHHIGVVVSDIAAHAATWQRFGLRPATPVIHDPRQSVHVQFWSNGQGLQVELIEPAAADSPVQSSVEKGGGLNHICYEVDDLDAVFSAARASRAIQVCAPVPAVAFEGRRICFLFYAGVGLVEYVESADASCHSQSA